MKDQDIVASVGNASVANVQADNAQKSDVVKSMFDNSGSEYASEVVVDLTAGDTTKKADTLPEGAYDF